MTANVTPYVVLRSAAEVHIGETRQRSLAALIVDPRRPLEIGIELISVPGPVWWVSRGLLEIGLVGLAGEMDVIVQPVPEEDPPLTQVLLHASHDGDHDCVIRLLRSEVHRAVTLSWQLTDRDAESEWIELAVNEVIRRSRSGRHA